LSFGVLGNNCVREIFSVATRKGERGDQNSRGKERVGGGQQTILKEKKKKKLTLAGARGGQVCAQGTGGCSKSG